MKNYLFIFSPPYSGSTLLQNILKTSSSVSTLENGCSVKFPQGAEGMSVKNATKYYGKLSSDRQNKDFSIDYNKLKIIQSEYWDFNKDYLLEKTPSNILRANLISEIFKPLKSILLIRNPYALWEGLYRKKNVGNNRCSIKYAAEFVVNCFKYQLINKEILSDYILIKYEDIVNLKIDKIINFLPSATDIDLSLQFYTRTINGTGKFKIINTLNDIKIKNISPEQLSTINKTFYKHKNLFKKFNYNLL